MKKRKVIVQKTTTVSDKVERINNALVAIRRVQLNNANNDVSHQAKIKHFNKMFRSIKEDDQSNFIEFFFKVDDWQKT